MKVAYVLNTPRAASYKVAQMILPQLEAGTHGVEVVGIFFFDDNVGFARDSLAWGADRLYAVVEDFSDGSLRLYTLTGYSLPAPLLYLGGSGNGSSVGTALQWDVNATFSGQPYAGRR